MNDLNTFLGNHSALVIAITIIFILLFIIELLRAKRKTNALTPLDLTQKINHEHAVIFDLRSEEQYRHGHIIDAKLQSRASLLANNKLLDKYRTKPIALVCANGMESQKTAAMLLKSGYNAYSLAGGMRAWLDAQLPVVKE